MHFLNKKLIIEYQKNYLRIFASDAMICKENP